MRKLAALSVLLLMYRYSNEKCLASFAWVYTSELLLIRKQKKEYRHLNVSCYICNLLRSRLKRTKIYRNFIGTYQTERRETATEWWATVPAPPCFMFPIVDGIWWFCRSFSRVRTIDRDADLVGKMCVNTLPDGCGCGKLKRIGNLV